MIKAKHEMMRITLSIILGISLLFFLYLPPAFSKSRYANRLYDQTVQVFELVNCLTPKQFDYHKGLIKTLDYTGLQVFRSFCYLPTILPEEAITVLERLSVAKVKYEHLDIFNNFIAQDGVSMEDGWHLLRRLDGLGYTSSKALQGLSRIPSMSIADIDNVIDQVQSLDEAGQWAVKSFLLLPGQSVASIKRCLSILHTMDVHQRWAVDSLCQVQGANVDFVSGAMEQVSKLPDTDANNVKSLFKLSHITPGAILYWLKYYFNYEIWGEESRYFTLSNGDKSILLESFSDSSDYLVWKINNLHDVTDRFGHEVGSRRLSESSLSRLSQLFNRLVPSVRQEFGRRWRTELVKGDKNKLIDTLKLATSASRSQVAKDLTSANIYILLSGGSELYDSSFRNILVPVLKKRIVDDFSGNLLEFLLAVDPNNLYISDFVISLAQKGKLATFFPKRVVEQKKVLDLVAESAFQDEKSLILFSATFMNLLQIIEPATRSYLIDKMLGFVDNRNTVFTIQLRVILQYYLDEYSRLLGLEDRKAIGLMIARHGSIELDGFAATAFKEWKSDGELKSLSVFKNDDDGRKSFFSNCRTLLANGYRPKLSSSYSPLLADGAVLTTFRGAVKSITKRPTKGLANLYDLQVSYPVVIDWVKQVRNIEIGHSVFIYQGESAQQLLLEQFIKRGYEMFAQRGHSYWRKEQLLNPLSKLIEEGAIDDRDILAKQRFMSIGSCGGIRAYSELNHLFKNNVDILATVGTGKSRINDPYNQKLFEIVAEAPGSISWKEIEAKTLHIFEKGLGEEYLQPGGLPAILHKIMDQDLGKNKS